MRKLLLGLSAMLMLGMQVAMAQPELKTGHPDQYTVVKGDTLWGISSRFLDSPWLWPEIWHANPQVENPHLIYPGDVLGLVYVKGLPKVTTIKRNPNGGVIKLSPQARATPLTTAIPAIPLDAISQFLNESRIVDREELEAAPYVLVGKGDHILTGAGDDLFARGDVGDYKSMGIFRSNKTYVDPETNEFLGLEAKSIAKAKVKAINGEVVTLNVQRSSSEILQGDRLLPTDDRTINSMFHPSEPEGEVNGYMIDVVDGVSQIGQYAVVVINKGERDGVKEGNVLAVYKKGGIVQDPYTKEKIELPADRAGVLMVFRTFEKMSYGLVLKALRPLSLMDEVRNP